MHYGTTEVCMFSVIVDVFFFKQKTAYEMRISDWSSDVCSSDLQAQRHTPGPSASLHGGAQARAKTACRGRRGDGRRVLDIAGRQSMQIGRASCRERVCQYV